MNKNQKANVDPSVARVLAVTALNDGNAVEKFCEVVNSQDFKAMELFLKVCAAYIDEHIKAGVKLSIKDDFYGISNFNLERIFANIPVQVVSAYNTGDLQLFADRSSSIVSCAQALLAEQKKNGAGDLKWFLNEAA